jgi:hypothetical protein
MLLLATAVARVAHQVLVDAFTFIAPLGFQHPMTRAHDKLLGPCFKTGRKDDQLLRRDRTHVELGQDRTGGTVRVACDRHRHPARHPTRPAKKPCPTAEHTPRMNRNPKARVPASWPQSQVHSAIPGASTHSTCKCTAQPPSRLVNSPNLEVSDSSVATAQAECKPDTLALSVSISSVSRPL